MKQPVICLWKGFHSEALLETLRGNWESGSLTIVCPPFLSDYSFIDLLPEGEIIFAGENASDFPDSLVHKKREKYVNFPEQPSLGVFTSGTLSGRPRLVLYSRSNILHSLKSIRSFFETERFDEIFCYPPPFHTFGLILGYMQAIVYHLKLSVLEGRYSRSAHSRRFEIQNPKVLTLGAPSHFYDYIQHIKSGNLSPASSYSCIIGGAKVSVDLWKDVRNLLQIEQPSIGYGSTEACPGVTHLSPGHQPYEEGEIGVPLPGVSVKLYSDLGIEFSGPSVCLAVIDPNEKDGNVLSFPKSILLTDLIDRRESDGIFIFRGRRGLIINRGGTKFSMEYIEELLRRELGLQCACVIVENERLGEDVGLLVENKSGESNLSQAETRQSCSNLLFSQYGYRFELPVFRCVDRLPLNENGKTDRSACQILACGE